MQVEARITGRREVETVDLDITGTMTVGALVEEVVRAEVAGHEQRRAERVLPRVLTPEEIVEQTGSGRVDSGGRRTPAAPDAAIAVATAVRAFEDGLWFVFIDGARIEDLADQVTVTPTTTVRFVRLVALAGG